MKRPAPSAGGKPLVASAGTAPPPASQGRLQSLSRLGHLASKTPVLGLQDKLQTPAQPVAAAATGQAKPVAHRQRRRPPPLAKQAALEHAPVPRHPSTSDAREPPVPVKNIPASSKSRSMRAAEKYVIEREQKRVNGFDIPKHKLYTFSEEIAAEFVGLRQVDGQALALIRRPEGIEVLPVDATTAQRLKRTPRGQLVTVTAKGGVRTKGRSR